MAKITIDQVKERLLPKGGMFKARGKQPKIEYVKSITDSIVLFKKDDSYVLCPLDDTLNPIIGQFDEMTDETIPPSLEDWMDSFNQEIQYFQNEDSTNLTIVDLGLSIGWSTTNLGASKPEDIGDYYAWGEVETKSTYTTGTYKYYDTNKKAYISIGKDIAGQKYDPAYQLSDRLLMPTEEQVQELIDKCTWTLMDDEKCWRVTGPNGNSIILPISGYKDNTNVQYKNYCYLWTSTHYNKSTYQAKALKVTNTPAFATLHRRIGAPIRPVSLIPSKKEVKPLITFKWNQQSPFNSKLPIDPSTNKRVLTGCGATSAAMVIAYWGKHNYRRGCTKVSSYISNKGKTTEITLPELKPITVFDFDNMLNTISEINKSATAKDAVSTLISYIGNSLVSDYTSNGTSSTTSNTLSALKNKFRMGANAKIIYASNGAEDWKEQIYKELENNRPVLCRGNNAAGTGGHIFIVDGYDPETDKFHFNWGWGGSYDGWFDINILTPTSTSNYSYKKAAIVGIQPDYKLGDTNNDGKITVSDIMNIIQNILNKKFDIKLDINSDAVLDESDIQLLVNAILENKNI